MTYQIIPELDPKTTKIGPMTWYHEEVKNSDTLLMALGDSWTWGDGLGSTLAGKVQDDTEHRLTHIYGNQLSKLLNSDFVNAARPGCSNLEIFKNLQTFLPAVVDKYKKIYVVVTLTENGREFNESPDWPIVADWNQLPDTLDGLLEDYERRMFENFINFTNQYSNVELRIGRSFTFSYDTNRTQFSPTHVAESWVEILEKNQTHQDVYPKDIRVLSYRAFTPIQEFLMGQKIFQKYKHGMFDLLSNMDVGLTWLENSIFNQKVYTKHPNEYAHQLWAKYLFSNISNMPIYKENVS